MKRSRLRRRRKQTSEDETIAEARMNYRFSHYWCQVPGCHNLADDIHEIARGGSRQAALGDPCAWLVLCRKHHEEMDDYSVWPIVRQLAVKAIADVDNYSRIGVNRLRGRDDEAITQDEVAEEIGKLLTKQNLWRKARPLMPWARTC